MSAWVVLLAVTGGIGADLATRTRISSLVSFAAVAATVATLEAAQVLSNRASRTLAALALAISAMLPMRASSWLAHLNSWTIVALLAGACMAHVGLPEYRTSSLRDAAARALGARFGCVLLVRSARPRSEGIRAWLAPLLRGVLLALMPVGVITALLAQADVVFAEAVTPGLAVDRLVGHAMVAVAAATLIMGLVTAARTPPASEPSEDWRPLGGVEALTVMVGLFVVYLLFAGAQLYSALGGADEILARQGITPADYARSGFFQLLWVAGLTAVLLGAMRLFLAERSAGVERALRVCGTTVALLTLVIIAVAIVRLDLYTDRFGLTTLRWYSAGFAWLLAPVFALIAIASARGSIEGLGTSIAAVVIGAVVLVNALNPEARVADHNLTNADTIELDAEYLLRLSADAWPTILNHQATVIDSLDRERGYATSAASRFGLACARADRSRGYGPAGYNVANYRLACASN